MRIVSGIHKGRHIHAPANLPVRPTTDFAKESLFNILNNNFDYEDLKVLDLFAGTGNISYEFASRGCKDITTVDSNFRCTEFIRKTAVAIGLESIRVVKSNAFAFLNFTVKKYDIIFADPPYDMDKTDLLPVKIFEKELLREGGWLIIEHSRNYNFDEHPRLYQHRMYGKVNFSIFKNTTSDENQ